jgi:protein TonB
MITLSITAQNQTEKKKDSTKSSWKPIPEKVISDAQKEVDEELDVPFTLVEQVPLFPNCKEGEKAAMKKCFMENLQKHVVDNFNFDLPNQIGLSPGKKRLIVYYTIDKQGNVTGLDAKAPHPKVKEEAIRVFKLLPKFTPGKQGGKPVGVKFIFPMRFTVDFPSKD